MRFLCFCCEDEADLAAMSSEQWQSLRTDTLAYVAKLEQEGRLTLALPLKSVEVARSLEVRDERVQVTDGPFAETKEQIGGILLIEANDMAEALDIAAGWPPARIGKVEVRQVEEELPMDSRH